MHLAGMNYTDNKNRLLYVDDIPICASHIDTLDDLQQHVTQNFEMKDLGEMSQYLGMKITQVNGTVKVDQRQNTKEILKRFDSFFKVTTNVPMQS